ncbi:hypothetical protein [Nostoc commune]|uniref:hypothetical protein n=1 Tax=Nostoc commune TaxID=1178 RepID=UPI0018C469CF|nr:hypothetical protein [Nostoc commune]
MGDRYVYAISKVLFDDIVEAIATFTHLPRYDFMIVCGRSRSLNKQIIYQHSPSW